MNCFLVLLYINFLRHYLSWHLGADSNFTCQPCPPGTSTLSQPGHTSTACYLPCLVGTYAKDPQGNAECDDCPIDTYSNQEAAASLATCVLCSSTQVSLPGSHECTTCPDSQYKPGDGATTCEPCLVRHFCSGGTATQCHAQSQTVPPDRTDASAPRDCRCKPGYSHRTEQERNGDKVIYDNDCHACTFGFYSSQLNSTQCSPCGAGFFSTVYASLSVQDCALCPTDTLSSSGKPNCTMCPAHVQAPEGSATLISCLCNAGYTGFDGRTCSACVPGKFKTVPGTALCSECPEGTYSTVVASHAAGDCQLCPHYSHSAAVSDQRTDCTCNAGSSGPDGGQCELCIAGKHKNSTGSVECSSCLVRKYSTAFGSTNASVCQQCLVNSDSLAASDEHTDCKCNAGSTGPTAAPACFV